MEESLKWRCGICGAEFLTENPPTDAEDAQMQTHVLLHGEPDGTLTEDSADAIIAEELEKWYARWHE